MRLSTMIPKSGPMNERAELYAQKIRNVGEILPNFEGFIAVKNIRTFRPGVEYALQQCVYSGHKQFHFLLMYTVAASDKLIIFVMNLSRKRHD